jgi:hypothetical protein
MIAAGTAASTETMELTPKAFGLMNATLIQRPCRGWRLFAAGHRWFAPSAKFRDHARAASRLSDYLN